MNDRDAMKPGPRGHRRRPASLADPRTARRRRTSCRAAVECLEGRSLLSYAGGLDFAYGDQGTVQTPPTIGPLNFGSTASAIQPDGKLVVVGAQYTVGVGSVQVDTIGFNARRYNADGTLDGSFADTTLYGVGQITVHFAVGSMTAPAQYTGATGVALQPDGKILVVGDVNDTALVARLDGDGSLDTSFGTDGVVTLGTAGKGDTLLDYASAVASLPGGLIAVGGASQPSPGHDSPAVEVLNADGSVDTSYGTGGLAVVPLPGNAGVFTPIVPALNANGTAYSPAGPVEMVAQPDGKVLIVADALLAYQPALSVEIVATRLTAAGTPDASYGNAGQATITFPPVGPQSLGIAASAIALAPDGGLIIGGSLALPATLPQISVEKLTPAGKADPTWDNGGMSFGVSLWPGYPVFGGYAGAIAVQPDGKVLIADGFESDYYRLDPDGFADPTFGDGGRSVIYANESNTNANPRQAEAGAVGVAIAPLGKILVTRSDSALTRLLGAGATGDYNQDGLSDPAVYDTTTATFTYLASTGDAPVTIPFGAPGPGLTLPAPGAYNGFGVDELGVYLPAVGSFAIKPFYATPYVAQPGGGPGQLFPFGMPGVGNSIPAPGDYDGSGFTELAVYMPSIATFAFQPEDGRPGVAIPIGIPGAGQDIAAPGDYFGLGHDSFAVYLPSMGAFDVIKPLTTTGFLIELGQKGVGNSIPAPGDYDGSGKTEFAVYEPSTSQFIYLPAAGGPPVTIQFGLAGTGRTLPEPGDYDGSGKTEVAAYFPSTGLFAYRPADGGPDVFLKIGTPNRTISFVANGTIGGGAGAEAVAAESVRLPASAEIPLTPDVLETLAGTPARKKAGPA